MQTPSVSNDWRTILTSDDLCPCDDHLQQAKVLKKKVMEERVGQAVAAGKAEAEKVQQAGGSQVLFKSYDSILLYVQVVFTWYTRYSPYVMSGVCLVTASGLPREGNRLGPVPGC